MVLKQASTNPLKEKRWNHSDVEYLYELAGTCTVDELATNLNRSIESVEEMLTIFGLKAKSERAGIPYSSVEDQCLIDNWPLKSLADMAQMLTRSAASVAARGGKLGLKKTREQKVHLNKESAWLDRDLIYLRANFFTKSNEEIGTHLNRSPKSILEKAISIGLKRTRQQINTLNDAAWTKEQDQYLIDHLGTKSNVILGTDLNRSATAISARMRTLGIRRTTEQIVIISKKIVGNRTPLLINNYKEWSSTDSQYLIDNWETKTFRQLAIDLNRSLTAIKSKAKKLKLVGDTQAKTLLFKATQPTVKKSSYRRFTQEEDDYLTQNWAIATGKEKSAKLGRTIGTIMCRAELLGLTGKQKQVQSDYQPGFSEASMQKSLAVKGVRIWTPEDDQYLHDNWATKSARELASALGEPSVIVVRERANKIGVTKKTKEQASQLRYTLSSIPDSLAANWITRDPGFQDMILRNEQMTKLVKVKQAEVLLKRIIRKQTR